MPNGILKYLQKFLQILNYISCNRANTKRKLQIEIQIQTEIDKVGYNRLKTHFNNALHLIAWRQRYNQLILQLYLCLHALKLHLYIISFLIPSGNISAPLDGSKSWDNQMVIWKKQFSVIQNQRGEMHDGSQNCWE